MRNQLLTRIQVLQFTRIPTLANSRLAALVVKECLLILNIPGQL